MPYAIDLSWTDGVSPSPTDARDWRRMAERVKRDHAMMRALVDDVERACRALEEGRPGSLGRFCGAVGTLYVAFGEHVLTEEAYFAPILQAADAWGRVRVVNMTIEHDEQRRVVLELVQNAGGDATGADVLVAQARALVAAFRKDMDSEDQSLDAGALLPLVVPDQEDG